VGQAEFTPMLPGDDQIVGFALDSTVSVTSSVPASLGKQEVLSCTVTLSTDSDRVGRVAGCCIREQRTKSTVYTMKNNSTAAVPRFYVDHAADVAHGGYSIVTKTNCIKQTAAFARYAFELPPQEVVEFVVVEEVTYETSCSPRHFLTKQSDEWLAAGLLSPEDRKRVFDDVLLSERDSVLDRIASVSTSISEDDVRRWKAGVVIHPASGAAVTLLPETLLQSLAEYLHMKSTETTSKQDITRLEAQMQQVFKNQERLRENIRSLEKVGDNPLLRRYLSDLDKEEDDLIRARQSIEVLTIGLQKLTGEIQALRVALSTSAKALRLTR
jgi:hypothetical protein